MRRVLPTHESGDSETRQIMRNIAAPKRRPPAYQSKSANKRRDYRDDEDRPHRCARIRGDRGRDDDQREGRERQSALIEEDAYKDDLQAIELERAYEIFHGVYGSASR